MAWTIDVVATDRITYSPTIALDTSANPYILFSKYRGNSGANAIYYLLLYTKVNGNWIADTFEDNCREPIYPPDLAIDLTNKIWCIYPVIDTINFFSHLIVAHKDSMEWIKDTIESSIIISDYMSYSITADNAGIPHIAYDADGGTIACYAVLTDSGWIKTVFDTNSTGLAFCYGIAVNSSNCPHISYLHSFFDGTAELWYAKKVDSLWFKEKVDSFFIDFLGFPTSIIIGLSDLPSIVYTEDHILGENPIVKYAYNNGISWHIDTVETLSGCSNQKSLDIDSLGKPYLIYCNQKKDKIAYRDILGWYRDTLPFTPTTNWGRGGSLRAGHNGLINIARYATDDSDSIHEIHYIYGTPTEIEESNQVDRYINNKFFCFPNLFERYTTIYLQFNSAVENDLNHRVSLKIYDIIGRLVKTLINDRLQKGCFNIIWYGRDENNHEVNSGIYFCELKTETFSKTIKLIVLR